jgi:hypothetical protein
MNSLLIVTALVLFAIGYQGAIQAARRRVIAELDRLPVGIKVELTPSRVSARAGGESAWRYYWQYRTVLESISEELTVIQFGYCEWYKDHWILPRDESGFERGPLQAPQFAEWFRCPGAFLKPGKEVVDEQHWLGSDDLRSVRHKWYFVAIDCHGKRYKGEGIVDLLGELDESG